MRNISGSGVFIKRFDQFGQVEMKPYAHRDDYYILAVLTEGSAAVDIDFERRELKGGDILIVSPWQVHAKPKEETWRACGLIVGLSPEILTDAEAMAIDEYSISTRPFNPGKEVMADIAALCSILERNRGNDNVAGVLASAVKSLVINSLGNSDLQSSDRYRSITLKLKKLLDIHLNEEKSPSAYASMLNISEVYLNEAVKGSTGLSVGKYIRGRVIVQAKRQLAYTSLSAKEIAYALGYEDYAYFSKLFRKSVGQSPTEYRKNLR